MEIKINNGDERVVVSVCGRLDTNTAPELEACINDIKDRDILLECAEMEYVSSAGLRVILAAHKRQTAASKSFTLRNLTPEVRSVLDMTGFSRILSIE